MRRWEMQYALTVEYSKKEIVQLYKEVIDYSNEPINKMSYFLENVGISSNDFYKNFKSWKSFNAYLKDPESYESKEEKERIKVANKALMLYKKHGRLTTSIMINGGVPQLTIARLFGSFKDMTDSLSIPLTKKGLSVHYTDEDYFANLVQLEDKFGYVNYTLINEHSSFTSTNYIRRYGTISEACFRARVRHIGNSTIIAPASQAIQTIREAGKVLKDNYYHTEVTFDWLRSKRSNRPMPVDAYFPYQNLVIEFHGPHHYNEKYFLYNKKYKNKITFKEQKADDLYKKNILLKNGYRYVSVYDYESNDIKDILHTRIEEPRF